ncbi:MAG TPA: DUF1573 domain-containing protein [Bacteroidales bacterium]|jgi:hypothetical protein|nr:DUF1573 domain-containing protein [Bacteroidales bacterium]
MKKIVIFPILLFTVLTLFSQAPVTKTYSGTSAEIQFESITLDLGTMNLGEVKELSYTFTNIGKKPLILDDVIISCDCTEIDYPKAPTMPGQSGKIKVKYTATSAGSINKWATVLSNAETDRVILKLKGKVI